MVHTWIRAYNERLSHGFPSMGARHYRKALAAEASFYGDYELHIYIGTLNDYTSLWEVAKKVIRKGDGWIRSSQMEDTEQADYSSMRQVLAEIGSLSESAVDRILPRGDRGKVLHSFVVRNDGNFKLIAAETEYLYYVVCFATS